LFRLEGFSISNTWGDDWLNMNLNEDIEMLKKWIDYAKFLNISKALFRVESQKSIL